MKINTKNIVLFATLLFLSSALSAQINPLGSQFFQNKYLANAAMAGNEQGLNVNFGYRDQWSKIQGAPRTTSATAEYRADRVGLGLNFYKEQAGLLNNNSFKGTFAYHLPIGSDQQELHFGLSLGLNRLQINYQDIIADPNDPAAQAFNDRPSVVDGDFGFAYTNNKLTVEGAVSNIKNQLQADTKNTVDYNTFYSAVSYQFEFTDWKMAPKVSYRGIKNYTNILDLAVELKTLSEDFGAIGMYHSNNSLSLGISYEHKKLWEIMSFYNTPAKDVSNYTNGAFELALRVHIPNAKKVK